MSSSSSNADDFSALKKYAESLDWGPGQRDHAGWKSFLRAGSLGVPLQEAVDLVVEMIKRNGGSFNAAKLQSQVRRAYKYVGSQSDTPSFVAKPPKAAFEPEKLKGMAATAPGIDANWLRARSPLVPAEVTSAGFLNVLFQKGEKIIVFTQYESQGQHLHVVDAEESNALPEGGTNGVWFLVNPVDGEFHTNPRQDNKKSRRSEESITDWRYLVLESDVAEASEWLACLVQLPLKIAAIYTSGGKSIHALVRVDAVSKQHWDEERDLIKPILVTLGADPQAMTAVRLSRLPGTLRGDRRQELLYLAPNPDGRPIISKAASEK